MEMDVADQASEQSAVERIASKFGFPQQAEPEAPEGAEEATSEEAALAEIEWNGKKYSVDPELREAFMKNEDYTRKTQELAEQRRAYDHAAELARNAQIERQFSDSIRPEQQEISVIDAYLQQMGKLNWQSMSTEDILRNKIEIDNVRERRAALEKSVTDKRDKFNQDIQARISELRGKAREMASKSIKGFSEDAEKSMREFAKAEGLTEAEVDNVLLDPRSFRLIWKAMQFDKVQQNAKPATQAVKGVLKPGAASEKMPAKTAAALNFAKNMKAAKSSGEKARVIEDRLGSMFARHS